MNTNTHTPFGTLSGILACLIWSLAVLVVDKLAKGFGPLFGAGMELLIAGVIFFAFILYKGETKKLYLNSRKYYFYCSIFWLINISFFWLALSFAQDKNETVLVGMINYLWPSLTIALSIPILGYVAKPTLLLGVGLSILGVVYGKLAIYKDLDLFAGLNIKAYLTILVGAVAWALYSNLSKKLSSPSATGATPIFMLAGGVLLTSIAIFQTGIPNPSLNVTILLIAWSAITGLGYMAWDFGMRHGNIIAIGATSMCIPFISTMITAYSNSVPISIELILSAIFVVCGAYVCKRSVKNPT